MWEPFTERARRAIVLAQEWAIRYGSPTVGLDDVIIGIFNEGESVLVKKLTTDFPDFRNFLLCNCSSVKESRDSFTEEARLIINKSFEVARFNSHNYIGTEHLLISIYLLNDNLFVMALRRFGIDFEKLISSYNLVVSLRMPLLKS